MRRISTSSSRKVSYRHRSQRVSRKRRTCIHKQGSIPDELWGKLAIKWPRRTERAQRVIHQHSWLRIPKNWRVLKTWKRPKHFQNIQGNVCFPQLVAAWSSAAGEVGASAQEKAETDKSALENWEDPGTALQRQPGPAGLDQCLTGRRHYFADLWVSERQQGAGGQIHPQQADWRSHAKNAVRFG